MSEVLRRPFPTGRASVPVVGSCPHALSSTERGRLADIAAKLLRNEPALGRGADALAGVRPGLGEGPALLLGDQREIGLHLTIPMMTLEHRIAVLAGNDDLLALEDSCPVHERYLCSLLGIGNLRVIALGAPGARHRNPAARRCRDEERVFRLLLDAARDGGRFQIIPHYGGGAVWSLAAGIARRSGVPVAVAAGPARVTRRVNDKIWFASCVRELLGPEALPPTFAAYGPSAVAARVALLARRNASVVVKTRDSAGALGNVRIDSALVRGRELKAIRRLVLATLHGRGWSGQFPLLVGVWELDALASPSVQVWVPPAAAGDPVVEGIFEQRLSGPNAEFVGAVPARLPGRQLARLERDAVLLATLFQQLGYFGRCSFDCLLSAPDGRETVPHWIECNGRWGGVSLPMTLANRLLGDHARHGFVVVQNTTTALATTGIEATYEHLGELLWSRATRSGIVPLSVEGFAAGLGVHLLALAATQQAAEALAARALQRLASPRHSRASSQRVEAGG